MSKTKLVKGIFSVLICLFLCCSIALSPSLEQQTNAAVMSGVTAAILFGLVSAAVGLTIDAASDVMSTPGFTGFLNDFVEQVGDSFEMRILAGRAFLSGTRFQWRLLIERIKLAFGGGVGSYDKFLTGYNTGAKVFATYSDVNWESQKVINDFRGYSMDDSIHYSVFEFAVGDYCYKYYMTANSNYAQFVDICESGNTNNVLLHLPITPDYQGYGPMYAIYPVYIEDEDRVYINCGSWYFKNNNYCQYGRASFRPFELGEGITKDDVIGDEEDSFPVHVTNDPTKDKLTRKIDAREIRGKILQNNELIVADDTLVEPIPAEDDDILVTSFPVTDLDLENLDVNTWPKTYGKIQDIVDSDVIYDNMVVVKPNVDTDTPVKAIEAVQTLDVSAPDDNNPPSSPNKFRIPRLLLSKFPFCIPSDLMRMVSILNAPAQQFIISKTIRFYGGASSVLTIDLTDFEDTISLMRWFIYFCFCAGLAAATKKFMF